MLTPYQGSNGQHRLYIGAEDKTFYLYVLLA